MNTPITPIDDFLKRQVITHQEEFLFGDGDDVALADPAAEIVVDAQGEGFADAPPEAADYRPAEIEAIACWNCAHFQRTGVGNDNWPVGLCHQWEAKVEGESVCDKFTADATMSPWPPHKHSGEEDGGDAPEVEEYSGESSHLVEVFLSGDGDVTLAEDTGLITKAILRTGEWKKTPSSKGVIRKPLKIIRDGVSSAKDRVVALSEIVENFEVGAYPNVPIPLTDEENKDHKNLLRLNTGWVKKLWIKDLPNGVSKLMAGLQFTEPDAREKVKRGTYPDVSSGIFFGIERPDGKKFNSALNHVAITHKPFMDGLGPFGVTASDDEKPDEIESLVLADEETDEPTPDWDPNLSFESRKGKVQCAIDDLIGAPEVEGESNRYVVKDLMGDRALIFSEAGEVEFVAEFSVQDDGEARISPTEDWQLREIEASQEDEQPAEPAAASESTVPRNETPLQQARRRRRHQARSHDDSGGGVRQMGKVKTRDISEVDFSNEEDAKKYAIELADANKELGKSTTEGELETRIEELKGLGFENMPGFLSTYRDIYLSDDGEAAMALTFHDDDGNETGSKTLTGIELADKLIAAIPTDKEGKILLSGQALDTGNNEAPDVEASDTEEGEYDNDTEKVKERTEGVAQSLGLDLGGKEE
jgi:hypothetical protein